MKLSRSLGFLSLALIVSTGSSYAQYDPAAEILEEITIIGERSDVATTVGSGQVIDNEALALFEFTDVQQILRDVPGVSVQLEDGYGLRPNLSIRGTATERSGRLTLLEDNVLISPAPYSAPSAYYFPTAARIHQVEVLKGSSAIKQGPYTVGGAINFVSTPIPSQRRGVINLETGSDQTNRLHAMYGDSQKHFGWMLESHLWNSDGFQTIDNSSADSGLDKDDWMLKLRFNSDSADTSDAIYHQLDVKLQYATENSDQSYLGLTDQDFRNDPYRRYGASQLDNIDTHHEQVILRYLAAFTNGSEFTATVYNNTHYRDWFKTEQFDGDGSTSANDFSGTSWSSIISAVNNNDSVASLSAQDLQAVLDGADSAFGALQLRNNTREYFSRGIQLGYDWDWQLGRSSHELEVGVRWHQDEEDRLQRNSTYSQINGELQLAVLGQLGNAGNRIQEAKALSAHVYDRISIGNWTVTPGFRYESIDQRRTRWEIRDGLTENPASRADDNLRSSRENSTTTFLPGVGVMYTVHSDLAVYAGAHRGFTAPSNSPGVDEEQSINYEMGLRYSHAKFAVDAAWFFTDYDNLLGECTSSSGSDCEIGSAFNGDAASITGVELHANYDFSNSGNYALPVSVSYTYLDGQFDSDIADTAFFGDVSDGDSLPYIPSNQLLLSAGFERAKLGVYARLNYVSDVCVQASCGAFEQTDSFTSLDWAAHYQLNPMLNIYAKFDNITQEQAIVGRQPYGARPLRDRSYSVGFKYDF